MKKSLVAAIILFILFMLLRFFYLFEREQVEWLKKSGRYESDTFDRVATFKEDAPLPCRVRFSYIEESRKGKIEKDLGEIEGSGAFSVVSEINSAYQKFVTPRGAAPWVSFRDDSRELKRIFITIEFDSSWSISKVEYMPDIDMQHVAIWIDANAPGYRMVKLEELPNEVRRMLNK